VQLNAAFNKWITTGLPLVIAKAGLSLDGRLTRPPGEGVWLTSVQSRAMPCGCARRWMRFSSVRARCERTIRGLTVRGLHAAARQPWRVVLTRSGRVLKDAHLFSDEHRSARWSSGAIAAGGAPRSRETRMHKRDDRGRGALLGSAFDARLVDRVHFYLAPLLCGGPDVIAGSVQEHARCGEAGENYIPKKRTGFAPHRGRAPTGLTRTRFGSEASEKSGRQPSRI